ELLKEYAIGLNVFDRRESFDPRTDTIVRVQARGLRQRLKRHYSDEGRSSKLVIEVPKGGYAPRIRSRQAETSGAPRRARIASLAVVTLLLAIGGLGLRSPVPPEAPAFLAERFLTYSAGEERSARFSPDGTRIAYSWGQGGAASRDIYVQFVDANANRPARVTSDPRPEVDPAWSPDGSQLVFARVLDTPAEPGEVWIQLVLAAPTEDSSEQVLDEFVASRRNGVYPAWSPDGRHIAFSCNIDAPTGSTQICVYSLDTGKAWPLTGGSDALEGRVVSRPDGLAIAFESLRTSTIHTLELTADLQARGALQDVVPEFYGHPVGWSLDSERLYLTARSPAGEGGLWEAHVTKGSPPPLITPMTRAKPGSSPDLWVGPAGEMRLIRLVADQQSDIVRVDLKDPLHASEPLVDARASDYNPQFSPDGSHFAFVSTRTGRNALWVGLADGSRQEFLTELGPYTLARPAWSHSGTQIAVDSMFKTKTIDLYVVDVPKKRSGPSLGRGRVPIWSKDGRWIYYRPRTQPPGADDEIWRLNLESLETELFLRGAGSGRFGLAHDSRTLYFTDDRSLMKIALDPDGRAVGEPLEVGANTGSFEVTRRGVYCLTSSGVVLRYSEATGQIDELFKLDNARATGGISVSPDGQWLLYTRAIRSRADLVLLESVE
ncbi:MAG: hypothetical protein O2795_17590, partial [Acidobacteria bacterium]|nr:hypothetical protein [Acidobacteriota bacterium]